MPDRRAPTRRTGVSLGRGSRESDGPSHHSLVADPRARPARTSPDSGPVRAIFGPGDLREGVTAAAVLLLLVFALDLTLWLAIALAVATYAGLALLRPRREGRDRTGDDASREQSVYRAALDNAAAIRALEHRIAKPAVREHVGRIAEQIDRVLAAMGEDRNLAAAFLFNEHVLEPFDVLLTEYVHLSARGVRSADGPLAKTETRDLPTIERAVDDFYEQLHRGRLIDLATLGEVIEFNLESIPTLTPRRARPSV